VAEIPHTDRTDRAILDELQADARLPLRDLADRVGLAPSTGAERVRRLRERGVITGTHAAVDPRALGRSVEAMVFAQVRPLSRELIDRFKADAMAMPEVLAVFVLAGGDDFLLHVGVPDVAALHAFLVDRLSVRREVVQFRSSIIYDHERKRVLENLAPQPD
jgi:DNA-binding Lrp family transcriptional regulator